MTSNSITQNASLVGIQNNNTLRDQTLQDQLSPGEIYMNHTKTVEYMVMLDALVQSDVTNFNQYCPLYQFLLHGSRQANPNASQEKKSSGRFAMQNPIIVIPTSSFIAELFQKLVDGSTINEIHIVRLGNMSGQLNQIIEEYKFNTCELQDVRTNYDTTRIEFRATLVEITINGYNQAGQKQGSRNVKFNLETGQLG